MGKYWGSFTFYALFIHFYIYLCRPAYYTLLFMDMEMILKTILTEKFLLHFGSLLQQSKRGKSFFFCSCKLEKGKRETAKIHNKFSYLQNFFPFQSMIRFYDKFHNLFRFIGRILFLVICRKRNIWYLELSLLFNWLEVNSFLNWLFFVSFDWLLHLTSVFWICILVIDFFWGVWFGGLCNCWIFWFNDLLMGKPGTFLRVDLLRNRQEIRRPSLLQKVSKGGGGLKVYQLLKRLLHETV